MAQIEYAAPASIKEAVGLMANGGNSARVLAGGTDLLVQLRAGRLKPGLIVDVKSIDEMCSIIVNKNDFRIGAAVCGAKVNEHKRLKKAWPGVCEALDLIGSTQIQGRATLGGNLCNASPAADSVPALIAASAVATIAGPNGRRKVPVEKISKGPGKTVLKKGEIVVYFTLPKPAPRSGDAYLRMIPRTEMDIAMVGAGVSLTVDKSGTCTAARVAIGAVAPIVILVADGAKALIGTKIDDAALNALAAAASAACNPIDDMRGTIEYRTQVAGVLARRAALIALERTRS
jgi:carbon-monoxide dehydrogenase medium subunit